MKVIVTGGSGFIGSYLLEALRSAGHSVLNVDIAASGVPIDVTKRNQLKKAFNLFKPNVVFHLAALASIPLCERYPKKAYSVNVKGTLNVAHLAAKHNTKLVLASSGAVYGNPSVFPTPEEHPLNPVNHYGITKLAAEYVVRTSTPNHVILRLFNVYGPKCRRSYVIPDAIKKIRTCVSSVDMMGTGYEQRDFVYIDDVVDAFMHTIKNVTGITLNVGYGRSISIRILVKILAKLARRSVSFNFEGKTRYGDFAKSEANIDRITKYLNWKPTISLENGLKRTLAQYEVREIGVS